MTGCTGDVTAVVGDMTGVSGDVSGCQGDMTGCTGDVSGIVGDVSAASGDMTGVTGDPAGGMGALDGALGGEPAGGDMPPPMDDPMAGAMDGAFVNASEYVVIRRCVKYCLWQLFLRWDLHIGLQLFDTAFVASCEERLESFLCVLLRAAGECKIQKVNMQHRGRNQRSSDVIFGESLQVSSQATYCATVSVVVSVGSELRRVSREPSA